MTQTELLLEATTMRSDQDGPASGMMMLIQVPAVRVRVGGAGRRPIRRLKREFRMAAYTGLAFLPLVLASSVWTFHPTRPLAAAEVEVETIAEPSAILISIESTGRAIETETETPVVFPGYLLPDDHREEPVHEGS